LSEISVLIEAEIHPTEDIEKVRRAIGNLFANVSFEVQPLGDKSLLRARTSGRDGLVPFQRFLREARIRDAARRLLMKGRKDRHIVFTSTGRLHMLVMSLSVSRRVSLPSDRLS
jgi:predicted RNA binding protein with dsRBD fold (UPF0201 family)